jgi:hypothetical protein
MYYNFSKNIVLLGGNLTQIIILYAHVVYYENIPVTLYSHQIFKQYPLVHNVIVIPLICAIVHTF